MRARNKLTRVLCSLFIFIVACAPESQLRTEVRRGLLESNLTSQNVDRPAKKTACLSFQGNGVYFAAHVGALISLLENNYEPVFTTGGSSGAILASVSRALVENTSLRGVDGSFAPQAAAIVFASSSPVIESIFFLPRFTTPLSLVDAFDVFFTGSAVGVLSASPNDAMVHAESIVGQATLVVEFYRTADFSQVVTEKNLAERERKIAALWRSFADAIRVTPDEFADALLMPRQRQVVEGRMHSVQIQDRFFRLFRSKQDSGLSNFRESQEQWNDLLERNFEVFRLNDPQKRRSILNNILSAIRGVESFDALPATLSGDFLLADPDRVYRAFEGFDSRSGRPIEIPSNVIIHTTARRASRSLTHWKEIPGLESLHQVYMSNAQQAARNARVLLQPANNPLQPSDKGKLPVIPTERLVVTELGLGPALAASTGEPTAFVRLPIQVDALSKARLTWISNNEQLIGSGGWLEKVSLGTSMKFSECAAQNVDLYFYTSDGEGVNRFAKMVFLGLFLDQPLRGLLARQIEDPNITFKSILSGPISNNQPYDPPADKKKVFERVLQSVDSVFAEIREVKARVGNLPVNFAFADPSKMGGASSKELNAVIRSNRRAMILAAYEFSRNIVLERGLGSAAMPLWNKRFDTVLKQNHPNDILKVISETMPRLSLGESR